MIGLAVPLAMAVAGSANPPEFPEPFRGVWDVSAKACAADYSDMRIRIDPGSIAYWESDGSVTAVGSAGGNDIRVTLAMTGEGETWSAQTRFVLEWNGNRMFAENFPQDGQEFIKTTWIYERCPDDTPMGWGGAL